MRPSVHLEVFSLMFALNEQNLVKKNIQREHELN